MMFIMLDNNEDNISHDDDSKRDDEYMILLQGIFLTKEFFAYHVRRGTHCSIRPGSYGSTLVQWGSTCARKNHLTAQDARDLQKDSVITPFKSHVSATI